MAARLATTAGGRELRPTAERDDGGGQVSVVVACDGLEQRGAALAPPDVLGPAGVGGPAG
ncbi:hypothetical protein OG401_03340 [Kitasatospora purpeofusca]|uniref:hypothetical protein n=1 Tax=Kitasatospora purpeofusca TaxID=67352 RepID=UPI0022527F2C|nr:hypothetical protein [Kitasatospora purpeofusca]MCX4683346.1 hypothetical protein [Kitasatospora purpeofusca]